MRDNNTTVGPIHEAAKAARALRRDMNALVPFLSGAHRNGFESGYITGLINAYVEERGQRPPTDVLAQWKERAARKARDGR
jgi:hypothetical protein